MHSTVHSTAQYSSQYNLHYRLHLPTFTAPGAGTLTTPAQPSSYSTVRSVLNLGFPPPATAILTPHTVHSTTQLQRRNWENDKCFRIMTWVGVWEAKWERGKIINQPRIALPVESFFIHTHEYEKMNLFINDLIPF